MRRARRAQSTVEYMLVVSVLVIALVAIGWVFTEAFGLGAQEMMQDSRDVLRNGTQAGSNDRR